MPKQIPRYGACEVCYKEGPLSKNGRCKKHLTIYDKDFFIVFFILTGLWALFSWVILGYTI